MKSLLLSKRTPNHFIPSRYLRMKSFLPRARHSTMTRPRKDHDSFLLLFCLRCLRTLSLRHFSAFGISEDSRSHHNESGIIKPLTLVRLRTTRLRDNLTYLYDIHPGKRQVDHYHSSIWMRTRRWGHDPKLSLLTWHWTPLLAMIAS